MVLCSPPTEHEPQRGACLAPTVSTLMRWLWSGKTRNPPWIYLSLLKGCACMVITLHSALFGRPKDV